MKLSNKTTILDAFYHWEKESADKTFLKQPIEGTFKEFTWKETGLQVRKLATYLKSLGLPDKSNIGLISKNCAEWIISDLAILMSGHISVPIYPTLTGEQMNQILDHSESKLVIIGKLDGWKDIKKGITSTIPKVSFSTYNPDKDHVQWDWIMANNEPLANDYHPSLEDIFTIIYTSGTTGNPKGVMLNYEALSEAIYETRKVSLVEESGNVFFSYLPLSHIAERNIVETVGVMSGGTIYFAESLETFAKNLQEAQPTHFLAVPRIWTKFQQGILGKLPKIAMLLNIPLLGFLLKKKIVKGLGLSNAKIVLTGAAPMPTSLIQWFRKLGITIQEAYGMTENLGAVCVMPKEKVKDGFVGKINPGLEVKIEDNTGEILTRSKWNMLGYFKEEKMTAETIDKDNWLHTGDVGVVDNEGYLKITGRVKEMYKTSKGEYVAPAQIEMQLAINSIIDQVSVVGESLPQPIALVVLSDMGKALEKSEMVAAFETIITELNPALKSYERIAKVVIMKDNWTVENGKLTPTLKIKRPIIEKEYGTMFEKWFEEKGLVVFQN